MSDCLLDKVALLVVELHGVNELRNLHVIEKLAKKFTIFHVHANNCCGSKITRGKVIPHLLEITYINNKYITAKSKLKNALPDVLDMPNIASKKEYALDYWL